jgi:hypothetical protein
MNERTVGGRSERKLERWRKEIINEENVEKEIKE